MTQHNSRVDNYLSAAATSWALDTPTNLSGVNLHILSNSFRLIWFLSPCSSVPPTLFGTLKFQWISDYETLHPFPIPPPARCFQFTWQLLICSPNPFLLGLTRFKVTPLSSWNFEKIVHSKVIVSTVNKKRSLTYLFPVSWPLLSASLRARRPVRNWSEKNLKDIRIDFTL